MLPADSIFSSAVENMPPAVIFAALSTAVAASLHQLAYFHLQLKIPPAVSFSALSPADDGHQ